MNNLFPTTNLPEATIISESKLPFLKNIKEQYPVLSEKKLDFQVRQGKVTPIDQDVEIFFLNNSNKIKEHMPEHITAKTYDTEFLFEKKEIPDLDVDIIEEGSKMKNFKTFLEEKINSDKDSLVTDKTKKQKSELKK